MPVKFCIGDLVEAQLTLMLVPLRGDQYKLTPVLRCLTMLDSKFSQVNNKSSIDHNYQPTHKLDKLSLVADALNQAKVQPHTHSTSIISFKRKVGYTNREETSGRMEVDATGEWHHTVICTEGERHS